MAVKKTDPGERSAAEQRRYEEIVTLQVLLSEGYSPVQIKEMLHTTYFRIRRYATGDPDKLCRFGRIGHSILAPYRREIISLLEQNCSFKQALEIVAKSGYPGKRTAFGDYCRKLIAELGLDYVPRRATTGLSVDARKVRPKHHYVSKSDVFKHLWSGREILAPDRDFIFGKHPALSQMSQCIQDFRAVFDRKDTALLQRFVEQYSSSTIKPIRSFASGLKSDMEAVKNAVISNLNNGFVEGNNNKIKAIKRVMYGRAKIDLLRIKVIFAR